MLISTLILFFLSIQQTLSDCCIKILFGECVQCSPGFHLYRKNCIFDIPNCIQYVNGFDCSICEEGFKVNAHSGKCQLQNVPAKIIPQNGFFPVSLAQSNSTLITTLIEQTQASMQNETGDLELTNIFIRDPEREPLQQIIRLVFTTEKGLLETVHGVYNISQNSSLIESKVIEKNSNEIFISSLDEPFLQTLILIIQKDFEEKQNKTLTVLDVFRQNLTQEIVNTSISNYRLFFLNPDLGIVQISSNATSIQPVSESVVQLDIDNLSPIIESAIEQLKAINSRIRDIDLVQLQEIKVIINLRIRISYNASFSDEDVCLWIQFVIPESGSSTIPLVLRQGSCTPTFTPAVTIKQECVIVPAQIANVTFIRKLSFDDFLLSKFKENNFSSYLLQCGGLFNIDLIDLLIAENQTMRFYISVFQIFDLQRDILILSQMQDLQAGNISFTKYVRVPLSNIHTTFFVIGRQINLTEQEQRYNDLLKQVYPQILNTTLTSIYRLNFTNAVQPQQLSFKYKFPKDVPYEEKQELELRLQISSNGQIKILPEIYTPKRNYVETSRFNPQTIAFVTNRIIQDFNVSSEEIKLQKFLINTDSSFEQFLIYFDLGFQTNVYLLRDSNLRLVQEIYKEQKGNETLSLEYIKGNRLYLEMTKFIELLIDQVHGLELVGVNRTHYIEQEFLVFIYEREQEFCHVVINNFVVSSSYRISRKQSNVETIKLEKRGYSKITMEQFSGNYMSEYENYLQSLKVEAITDAYISNEGITIIDSFSRIISINKGQYPSISQKKLIQSSIPQKILNLSQIVSSYQISIQSSNLILLETLSTPSSTIKKHSYKILTQNSQVFLITLEQASEYKHILLQLELIQSNQSIQVSSLESKDQQIKMVEYLRGFLSQETKIIKIENKQTKYKVIIDDKERGIFEYTVVGRESSFKIIRVRSINEGYEKVGYDQISLQEKEPKIEQGVPKFEETFKNLIEFSQLNLTLYQSKELILWKFTQFTNSLFKVSLYYEFANTSFVLKVNLFIDLNQSTLFITSLLNLPNGLLTLRASLRQQYQTLLSQFQNDQIFSRLDRSLRKQFWYYLRGASVVEVNKKINSNSSILYSILYSTYSIPMKVAMFYDPNSNSSRISSFTPVVGYPKNFQFIYQCFMYEAVSKECEICKSGYYLNTVKKCLPEIAGCIVQSGDTCIYSYKIQQNK